MIEYFPFVLSLSKHEFSFFSTLLVKIVESLSRPIRQQLTIAWYREPMPDKRHNAPQHCRVAGNNGNLQCLFDSLNNEKGIQPGALKVDCIGPDAAPKAFTVLRKSSSGSILAPEPTVGSSNAGQDITSKPASCRSSLNRAFIGSSKGVITTRRFACKALSAATEAEGAVTTGILTASETFASNPGFRMASPAPLTIRPWRGILCFSSKARLTTSSALSCKS